MDERPIFGRAGEELAAEHLRRRGYRIVDRNWRCSEGEIDLVARRGRELVFCEVKTRRSRSWGSPSEAVDARKRARLRRLAARWLRAHGRVRSEIRFDVVSIVAHSGRPEIDHVPGAW